MYSRTRNLLAALAEEGTDEILEALRGGGLTEIDLVDRVATDKRTTGRRLKELVDLGILTFARAERSPGKSGPRPKVYDVSDPAIFQFCDAADAFGLAFSEEQTKKYREHVDGSRRQKIGPAAEEDSAEGA